MKQKRLLYDKTTLLSYSDDIISQLFNHPYYKQCQLIGVYVSLPLEVNTISFIKEALKTKRICVPLVKGETMDFYEISSLDDLQKGHFNVLEPKENSYIHPSSIQLMIIPLLAYDKDKYRVGYGKGYYDRYMSHKFTGHKIGLAYHFSYVDHINHDQYDIALDDIITNKTDAL